MLYLPIVQGFVIIEFLLRQPAIVTNSLALPLHLILQAPPPPLLIHYLLHKILFTSVHYHRGQLLQASSWKHVVKLSLFDT